MKTIPKYKTKKEEIKAKRKNARIFPIYKMFSWDLLFFYSTQYLFYTMTKGLTAGEILRVEAFFPLFIIIMQLPAAICAEFLGRRKSLIFGNLVMSLYIFLLMVLPGFWGIFIANIVYAFGYSLKGVQETNILYDSTATRGGEGLYPKINAKGATAYYLFDGIASLVSGYLFVINQYLPMICCLILTLVSTIIAMNFKDIYTNKLEQHEVSKKIKEYKSDFKISIKNILKSKRLKALLIFMGLFNALVSIIGTYKGNILVELQIGPETFSIINAVLSLISAFASTFQDRIHKKFRNKTFSVLSISFVLSIILIGVILLGNVSGMVPIILILLSVRNITMANYFVLSERYSKNFSTPKTRSRISFSVELTTNTIEAVLVFLAGMLLDGVSISYATLIIGLVFLLLFVLVLDYMKTRVGLKPENYSKNDIELE
jgi:MFS family permease